MMDRVPYHGEDLLLVGHPEGQPAVGGSPAAGLSLPVVLPAGGRARLLVFLVAAERGHGGAAGPGPRALCVSRTLLGRPRRRPGPPGVRERGLNTGH